MLKISISIHKRRKDIVTTAEIPQSWSEYIAAGHDSKAALDAALTMPDLAAKLQILRGCLNLQKKQFNALSDEDIAALLPFLNWLKADASPEPLITTFSVKQNTKQLFKTKQELSTINYQLSTIKYHLTAARFENGSALEFALADDYFKKIVENQDDNALNCLCATLCREENTDETAVNRTGDKRIPLKSRAEVENRVKTLKNLSDTEKVSIFLYFAGVKKYIHDTYGAHIFEQPEPEDPNDPTPDNQAQTQKDPFGWWGIFMDLAENPTKLHDIHAMNFHELCLWLVRQKMQQERLKQMTATPVFKE